MGATLDPDQLDPYLQTLYFQHLSVPSSHVPTDAQRDYILTLPGLFNIYCHCFHLSPDHHLSDYDVAPFWDFVDEYKQIQASGCDPLAHKSDALTSSPSGSPDKPEKPPLHPLSSDPSAPLGSICLFPLRAPSQPPIATINAPSNPLHAPISDHARGQARPSVAQEVSDVTDSAPPALRPTPDSSLPWKVMGAGNKPISFASAVTS